MHFGALEALSLVGLGIFSGLLGALVGIGGGVIVVPVLVLLYGFDIRVAVATSLVTVVATSTTAGSVWVGKGLANMRLGMTLEVATTVGGLSGGLLATLVSPSLLAGLFGAMMGVTAALLLKKEEKSSAGPQRAAPPAQESGSGAGPAGASHEKVADASEPDGHEEPHALAGSFYDRERGGLVRYRAERLWLGGLVSLSAGIVSGMLGVGGGFIKVPAMHLGMRLPIQVSAATSNFMIGVTAISSLLVYLGRGLVHPALAAPVALGTIAGSFAGTRWSRSISARALQRILAGVLALVAVQMFLKAAGVSL